MRRSTLFGTRQIVGRPSPRALRISRTIPIVSAVAIADQHLLLKKKQEQQDLQAQWVRKAELAVGKEQDDLARAALDKALSHARLAEALAQQHADQTAEVDALRSAYSRLQKKLTETQHQVELLTLQLRRARAAKKAVASQAMLEAGKGDGKLARLSASVRETEAKNQAARTMLAVSSGERFAGLEQGDQIEALLLELKERQPRLT